MTALKIALALAAIVCVLMAWWWAVFPRHLSRWLLGLHHLGGYQWQFAWPHWWRVWELVVPYWHQSVDSSYPGVLLKHRTFCLWIVQVRWVKVALLPRGVPTPIRNRQAWGPDGSNADALPPRIDSRDRA